MSTDTEDSLLCSSTFYKDDPNWTDVTPIYPSAEEDGAVKIALTPQFIDAFAYFRAVLQTNEFSDRTLKLTSDCIQLNPANYTVWQYRREILHNLKCDLNKELKYLDDIITESPKNYQVWHHRRVIIGWVGPSAAARELDFTSFILSDESKNYHAWQHRQWVVCTFQTPFEDEMNFSLQLLLEDVRNNSAFNYRYFLLTLFEKTESKEAVNYEIKLAKSFIERTPNNESAWNYLSGLLINDGITSNDSVVGFVEDLYERTPAEKRSPFLVSFMADIQVQRVKDGQNVEASSEAAKKLFTELTKTDPVRANYWKYQRILVENLGEKAK